MAKHRAKNDRFVSPAAGVILLLFIAVFLFIAVSFMLRSVGLLTFPDIIENILSNNGDETTFADGEYNSLFEALKNDLPERDGEKVEISPEMLTELFLNISPPEKYYQKIKTVTSFDGENFREGESSILINGTNFTVTVSEYETVVKTVLGNGTAIRTSGSSGGLARTFSSVSGNFSVANEAGIPDISYIGNLIGEYLSGNDSGIGSYSVTSNISEEGNFISVRFHYSETDLYETYVISLYNNVIWRAESRSADGTLYYKAETLEFTTDIEGRS